MYTCLHFLNGHIGKGMKLSLLQKHFFRRLETVSGGSCTTSLSTCFRYHYINNFLEAVVRILQLSSKSLTFCPRLLRWNREQSVVEPRSGGSKGHAPLLSVNFLNNYSQVCLSLPLSQPSSFSLYFRHWEQPPSPAAIRSLRSEILEFILELPPPFSLSYSSVLKRNGVLYILASIHKDG